MASESARRTFGHLSLFSAPFHSFSLSVIIAVLLLCNNKNFSRAAFYTPCNYPVPNESTFEARCGNNYLRSTYICDVDRQISIAAVKKIDAVLSKYDIFSKNVVRVGVAVLRILEYPNWKLIRFPDVRYDRHRDDRGRRIHEQSSGRRSEVDGHRTGAGSSHAKESDPGIDGTRAQFETGATLENDGSTAKTRRHDSDSDADTAIIEDTEWHCLQKSQADFYRNLNAEVRSTNYTLINRYLQTFADSLRIRWFDGECAADIFFLTITDSVVDQATGRRLHTPMVQISYGQELKRVLPADYDQILHRELSSLSTRGMSPQVIIALAIERLGDRVSVQKLVERRMTSLVVDANGQHRIVTAIVVQHTIPTWAIYTFIGCIGSVGLALGLEWSVVRRKALSLRAGASTGGGERHRSSKSDNVQVHLYF